MQTFSPIFAAATTGILAVIATLITVWATRYAARQQEAKRVSDAQVTTEEDLDRRRIELYDAGVWKLVDALRSQNKELQDRIDQAEAAIDKLQSENRELHRQNDRQQYEIDQQKQTISDLRSDIRSLQRRPE